MKGGRALHRLSVGGGLVTLGNLAAASMGLVLLVLLAQIFTPEGLALVVAVIAIIDGGQMFLDGSVNTGVINLASAQGKAGRPDPGMLRAGWWSKLLLGLCFAALVALAAPAMSRAMWGDGAMTSLIMLAGGTAVIAGMQGFVMAVLTSHEAFPRIALTSIWKNLFRIMAILPFLLVAQPSPYLAALVICGVTLLAFMASAVMISWSFLFRTSALREGLVALFRVNRWMMVSALAMFGGRLDIWVIGFLAGPAQAGLYAVAAQLCVGVGILTQAMVTTLLPTVSRFDEASQMRAFLLRGTRTLAPLLLLPVIAWPVAGPVIGAIFGAEYADAAPVFTLLLLASVMTLVGAPLMMLLLSIGKADVLAYGTTGQLVTRLSLALLAVPMMGAVGLALCDVISRVVVMAVVALFLWSALKRNRARTTGQGASIPVQPLSPEGQVAS